MTKRPRIAVIIPARYRSTRFEGKPLADLGGRPMIYHVYHNVSACKLIDYLAVATDDERIANAVKDFGGNVVLTSGEHATGTDRVAEVASHIDADVIVNVQGDEPLVQAEMVEQIIAPHLRHHELDVTTMVTKIRDIGDILDSTVVKVVHDKNDFALFITRSPVPYPKTRRGGYAILKQLGLYAFRKEFLLEFSKMEQTSLEMIEGVELLRVLENGYKVKIVETQHSTISVDTLSDLYEVRNEMQRRGMI